MNTNSQEMGYMRPEITIDSVLSKLAADCLVDALDDILYEDTRYKTLRWFVSTANDSVVFSFGWVLANITTVSHGAIKREIRNRLKQGYVAYSRRSDKSRPVDKPGNPTYYKRSRRKKAGKVRSTA
jgi:hypothetical protein